MQLLLSTSTKRPDSWKLVGYTRERITLCIPSSLAFFPHSICWGLLSETSSERGIGIKWKLQWCCLVELPSCCCVCQVLVPEGFSCVKSYWLHRSCAFVSVIWIWHDLKIQTPKFVAGTGLFVFCQMPKQCLKLWIEILLVNDKTPIASAVFHSKAKVE